MANRKKYPEELLSHFFLFRMSDRDYAAFKALANAEGRSPSNYLRWLIGFQIRENINNEAFMEEYREFLVKDREKLDKKLSKMTDKELTEEAAAEGTTFGHFSSIEEERAWLKSEGFDTSKPIEFHNPDGTTFSRKIGK